MFEAYFMIHWLFFPYSKNKQQQQGRKKEKKKQKKLKMLIAGLYYQDPNHPYNLFDMMK